LFDAVGHVILCGRMAAGAGRRERLWLVDPRRRGCVGRRYWPRGDQHHNERSWSPVARVLQLVVNRFSWWVCSCRLSRVVVALTRRPPANVSLSVKHHLLESGTFCMSSLEFSWLYFCEGSLFCEGLRF